ncbi:hypothetical protein C8Q74DRAFT_1250391 [Fomes fomentarius]|nr:hypothetical protein C8Q74DRAFT_1250391 [Fomes fomentarius]
MRSRRWSSECLTFSARATIMHFKTDNIACHACPRAGCSRSFLQMGDGWRCEKCDQSYEKRQYRFIVRPQDQTRVRYATPFL